MTSDDGDAKETPVSVGILVYSTTIKHVAPHVRTLTSRRVRVAGWQPARGSTQMATPLELPGPASDGPAPAPERKRKSRWDNQSKEEPAPVASTSSRWGDMVPGAPMVNLTALSAASSSKMQAVEQAASSVVQHGPQFEATLRAQALTNPLYAWLLDPASPEHTLYQQRLKALQAKKQAALLTSSLSAACSVAGSTPTAAAPPTLPDIAAIAKAAAASVGVPLARPNKLPAPLQLQQTESGGVMASSTHGVGRVFYPPQQQPQAVVHGVTTPLAVVMARTPRQIPRLLCSRRR